VNKVYLLISYDNICFEKSEEIVLCAFSTKELVDAYVKAYEAFDGEGLYIKELELDPVYEENE
jgi:CRISPR/Cas system-associated protein Cas10 (large subunit of type III CRISPR-Cas system)